MNLTDDDIEDLVRRLRTKSNARGLKHSEQIAVKVLTSAFEDWLSDLREAGKARNEELIHQILGIDR